MKSRVKAVVFLLVAVAALGAGLAFIIPGGGAAPPAQAPHPHLPEGCVKPAGGYLIIANENGFNDSIAHGAPKVTWPIITVKVGTMVNIIVCNADVQAHGFQVTHYFDSNIETVEPGQLVHVSFLADRAGNYTIYCSIFCSIHIYMQSGELRVTAQ